MRGQQQTTHHSTRRRQHLERSSGVNNTRGAVILSVALHKKSRSRSSLCNLCVLCVSVVWFYLEFIHHRETEKTEVTQRNSEQGLFVQGPLPPQIGINVKLITPKLIVVLLLLSTGAIAQERSIMLRGRVVDANTGEAMANVR